MTQQVMAQYYLSKQGLVLFTMYIVKPAFHTLPKVYTSSRLGKPYLWSPSDLFPDHMQRDLELGHSSTKMKFVMDFQKLSALTI